MYRELLVTRYTERVDGEALEFLSYLRTSAGRMEMLLRDLLSYAHAARVEKPAGSIDSGEDVRGRLSNLSAAIDEVAPRCPGDRRLDAPRARSFHATPTNVSESKGNAIKYCRPETAHSSMWRRDALERECPSGSAKIGYVFSVLFRRPSGSPSYRNMLP